MFIFLTALPTAQPMQQGQPQINVSQTAPMQGHVYPMQQPAPGVSYPGHAHTGFPQQGSPYLQHGSHQQRSPYYQHSSPQPGVAYNQPSSPATPPYQTRLEF